ncbi:hypothetical protein MauCBS54593_001456 [Microsporum audouinii]
MPTRLPDSSITSISFDPLSPASSDSESDRDEAARAAKRRRIEQVARDYLQGQPPFILTATLNGPFDDGWVNPWRKVCKQQLVSPLQNTKIPTPQPVVRQPAPKTLQGTPSLILPTDSYQRRSPVDESQPRRIGANLGSRSNSGHSSKSRSTDASSSCLKKDRTVLQRPPDEPPKSSSPSPSAMLYRSRVSKRSSERSQASSSPPHRAGTRPSRVICCRTLNFTAINAPSSTSALVEAAQDASVHNKQKASLKSCVGESSVVSEKLLHKPSQKALLRLSEDLSKATPPTEPELCKNNQYGADISASTTSSTLKASNNSSFENAASARDSDPPGRNKTITKEPQKANITCNTFIPPPSQRENEARKTGSTLPDQDSETMPAAQIVPTIFTPPQLTPFTSADLLQLPFNQSNDSAMDGGPPNGEAHENDRSQASALATQGSATNDSACPPPLKEVQQRPPNLIQRTVSSNSLQKAIKPFRSFNGGPRGLEKRSKVKTQSKNARFGDEDIDIDNQANARRSSSPKIQQGVHGFERLATPASCPASLRPQKINPPAKPSSRTLPPGCSLVGEREHPSTRHSSGTPMSLTMPISGLTDLSTQPDGQGLLVLQENFDLTGAIEDAESFLQSWDIERDRQRLRDNNNTANGLKLPAPKV